MFGGTAARRLLSSVPEVGANAQTILHDHALKEEAMLVLSRKIGETISIGENVTVKVVRTQGGRVQIAIDAPREVAIRRGELAAGPPVSQQPDSPRRACA